MVALAAWHTKHSVEIVLSRADDIKMTGKRHPYISEFKIGVTKVGKILAFDVRHYQNSGATADLSTAVLERTLLNSTNSYFIPNVRVFGACCRTNLPPNTAFRGFGGPQGMFVIESAIAKTAEKLALPREQIQARNLLRKNNSLAYGQRIPTDQLQSTWEKAESQYGLKKIRNRIEKYNQTHFETKKGFAVMPINFGIAFTSTFLNQASALVHIYTDGSVSVTTGGVEMGQGISTNIARVAATAFGIHPDRIKVETTNTTRIANMSPSAASSTTLLNGNATLMAVNQILDRLKALVAKELGITDQKKIVIKNEKILYHDEETNWTWDKLIQTAYLSRLALSAHAFFSSPDIWFDKDQEKGEPFTYYISGTSIIEITLDSLRGIYDIDSVKIVHDLGRPLNELVDLGQVEGGLAQGLGWMTMEDLRFNKQGQNLSHALATYKVPDVYFMPDDIDITFLEDSASCIGPYGSKAVGEPPLMYGIGVFFAIRHAMCAFNKTANFAFASPLTPERVLLELHQQEVKEIVSTYETLEIKKETNGLH